MVPTEVLSSHELIREENRQEKRCDKVIFTRERVDGKEYGGVGEI